ncbi:MAG: TadE/TadG family type IV pilus assembly protein [Acidimicrobiia bacterium]
MRGRRARGEEGAALVEFAIVAPLLIMLVVGMAEFGLVFKDRLSVSAATQAGARVGSTLGTDDGADYAILEAVRANISGNIDLDRVTSVEIFEDLGGGTIGQSNSYVPDTGACGWSPCPQPPSPNYGGSWDPAGRDDALPGLDVLGVRINYQHDWITSVLPFMSSPANFSETARVRIEPAGLEQS